MRIKWTGWNWHAAATGPDRVNDGVCEPTGAFFSGGACSRTSAEVSGIVAATDSGVDAKTADATVAGPSLRARSGGLGCSLAQWGSTA